MLKYKQQRKLITITCDNCGVSFEKPVSEYKRNMSLNRHNFCSRSCCGKFSISSKLQFTGNLEALKLAKIARVEHYKNHPELQFRYYLRNCKKRFKECTITLNDLYNQWVTQSGICPYSGIKLKLANYVKNHNDPLYTASVDRIDSSEGYIPGNIQFVSTSINYMKNTLSDSDTKYLCKCIAEYFYSD